MNYLGNDVFYRLVDEGLTVVMKPALWMEGKGWRGGVGGRKVLMWLEMDLRLSKLAPL